MSVDISQQAVEARDLGINEVVRLLQQPEDLARLSELRLEYDNRAQATRSALSSVVQSQVEAARNGMDLLERSQRHIAKLKASIDKVHLLCEECDKLIDHQDKIKVLSMAHANIHKVLSEIEDIVDLPTRAEMVLGLLEDSANILPAFEALTVLEGTAENAKAAWKGNIKAAKHDMSSMMHYLDRVSDVMAEFEARLWAHVIDYEELSQKNPTLLVDCLRIIELQEQLDDLYRRTKMESTPKRFRRKLLQLLEEHIAERFRPLVTMAEQTGVFNKKVKYDTNGDLVLDEQRDYLGNLTSLTRISPQTGKQEVVEDEGELRGIDIIEEEIFDEDEFLNDLLVELYGMEETLAIAYDSVAPCFPPSYSIFDLIVAHYHSHLAAVIDTIGRRAKSLSTKGALRVMEFVRKYMETLRGLGVEEEYVRLGVAEPKNGDDPDAPPPRAGLDLLMECYITRMEDTVSKWYNNILAVDLKTEPKPGPKGTLRTPGATDFFRIMNEEIAVIQSIDDHGEVMFETALSALRVMRGFQAAQEAIISERAGLSFEMLCAQLNNNVDCHDQSTEFAEEVQGLLEPQFRKRLDIEEVCRGFLEVAKTASKRLVHLMFNDPGIFGLLKAFFVSPEWLSGTTTATLLATVKDYMGDIKAFVEPSFIKRVAEAALDELVRRTINIFIIGTPQVSEAVVQRMAADQGAFAEYFAEYLRPDRLEKAVVLLDHLRKLVSSADVPSVVLAYNCLLMFHPNFSLEVLQRALASRNSGGIALGKKEEKEVIAQCREMWKLSAAGKQQADESKGWFSWG